MCCFVFLSYFPVNVSGKDGKLSFRLVKCYLDSARLAAELLLFFFFCKYL